MSSPTQIDILLFDDDAIPVCLEIRQRLGAKPLSDSLWEVSIGYEQVLVNCTSISNPAEAEKEFLNAGARLAAADVILLDNAWEHAQRPVDFGLKLLEQAKWYRGRGPLLAIYTVAPEREPDFIGRALRHGADALISKGEKIHLLNLLVAALDRKRRRFEEERLRKLAGVLGDADPELLSGSPVMQRMLQDAALIAPFRNETVVLLGEVGTGKSRVARVLHKSSTRALAEFVTLDPGHHSDTLFHAELFGAEKGAYTDARTRKGILESAEGGTVFVDELENMSHKMQESLLRVIEERVYFRTGDPRERKLDVRFFFATNRDPKELIRAGTLREDFFSRINENTLQIPPLRERLEDIPRLAELFVAEFYKENLPGATLPTVTADAIERLRQTSWSDNIRGLRNTIRRSLVRLPAGQDLHAGNLILSQQPDIVTALGVRDIGSLLGLAPRAGSQRAVFDRLVERIPDVVPYFELNRALELPESDAASEPLMVAVSRLRSRLKQGGFDIRQDRAKKGYLLVRQVDDA